MAVGWTLRLVGVARLQALLCLNVNEPLIWGEAQLLLPEVAMGASQTWKPFTLGNFCPLPPCPPAGWGLLCGQGDLPRAPWRDSWFGELKERLSWNLDQLRHPVHHMNSWGPLAKVEGYPPLYWMRCSNDIPLRESTSRNSLSCPEGMVSVTRGAKPTFWHGNRSRVLTLWKPKSKPEALCWVPGFVWPSC